MDILYPKDKRLEIFQNIRPVTAPDTSQKSPNSPSKGRKSGKRCSDPETASQHVWNARKPRTLQPIPLDRNITKARRVIQRAESENFSKINKIGSPGGHIARLEAEKRGERLKVKFGQKLFFFSENMDEMLSFHTTDTTPDRPPWSQRFVRNHVERAEKEVERRKKKRAKAKSLSAGQNAINVTMHDVVAMYTSALYSPPCGKGSSTAHPTPIHLNDDEIHVWQKLRVSLHKCGQYFSHKCLDEIAARYKSGRYSMHPSFAHFLRYMNIILGGSTSLQAARHILLTDDSYLLKLLQEVCVYIYGIYMVYIWYIYGIYIYDLAS